MSVLFDPKKIAPATSNWRKNLTVKGFQSDLTINSFFLTSEKSISTTQLCEHNLRHILSIGSVLDQTVKFVTVNEEKNSDLKFSSVRTIKLPFQVSCISWRDELFVMGSNDRKVRVYTLKEMVKDFGELPMSSYPHPRRKEDKIMKLKYFPLQDEFTFNDDIGNLKINTKEKSTFVCSINNQVHIWSLKNNAEPVASLRGSKLPVSCLEWSNDGNLLSIGSETQKIKIVDMRKVLDGRKATDCYLFENVVHSGNVFDFKWNPTNFKMFATCGEDGMVRVWDLRKPKSPLLELHDHKNIVKSVSWSNDGKEYLVSGGIDCEMIYWDTKKQSSAMIKKVTDFGSSVEKVLFSKHNLKHSYAISMCGEICSSVIVND